MNDKTCTCEVLIIGFGPSGMMLANELKKYGVTYLAVDKRKAVSEITRAVNITPATIATLRFSLGIDCSKEAMKTDYIKAYCEGNLVSRVSYRHQTFPYKNFYYLPQPAIETMLFEQLSFDEGKFFEETEVIGIEKNEEGYRVVLKKINSLNEWYVQCQYLIGADGNNSFVREWSKIESQERDLGSNFMLFDIETVEPMTQESDYYLFEDGYVIIVPTGNKCYRVILSSRDLSSFCDKESDINFLSSFLLKKCQLSIKITRLIWKTEARFKDRIALDCRQNNLFLIGDAFHIFSPVGGLNLNTGLQDAINLGWKLAYVIKGYAPCSLLNTYGEERYVAIKEILKNTEHLTQVMTDAYSYSPARRYLASKENKNELKHHLPEMLSGYSRYTTVKKEAHFLQGYHLSEFISDKNLYEALCQKIDSTKFNFISSARSTFDFSTYDFLHVLVVNELNLEEKYILVRPDGYIQHVGEIDVMSDFNPLFLEQ